jgi:mercuric reductase
MRYDLAIIGSGGAAFAAAITARDAGASVVMIERGTTGGTCVNTGCVPSKALLAAAAARHDSLGQRFPGIATSAGPADMAALTRGKDELVTAMRAGKYVDLAADYGWEITAGTARFAGSPDTPELQVSYRDGGTVSIEAGHYLIATGAAPWIPPVDGLEQAGYLTSATAMELTELPESMLVIGGERGRPGNGADVRPARNPGHHRRGAGPARPVRRAGGLRRDRGRPG